MKHTTKYCAAVKTAAKVLPGEGGWDNAVLYDHLERKGWFWNAESGEWENIKHSTSMFQADDGGATGVFRLRVMANPGDMPRVMEIISESLDTYGIQVTETSNLYPNKRGPGVRIYLTCGLPEPKKGEENE